jgi:hypothetical protein
MTQMVAAAITMTNWEDRRLGIMVLVTDHVKATNRKRGKDEGSKVGLT